MKAMILAAGRGERLRPLTDKTPKPLLTVGSKALIEYHIEKLSAIGIREVVINTCWLGNQIRQFLGGGSHWQLNIHYSIETQPLETAGGILNALPLLGDDPFLLISGDIWTDYPFESFLDMPLNSALGHLILVDNPKHNPGGDYAVRSGRLVAENTTAQGGFTEKKHGEKNNRLTFSGLSVLSPGLIKNYPKSRTIFPLSEVFSDAAGRGLLTAAYYRGQWWDIGTSDRLRAMDRLLSKK